jgi:uncharacterized protein YkwD
MMRIRATLVSTSAAALLIIAASCSQVSAILPPAGSTDGVPPTPTLLRGLEGEIHDRINRHRASRGLGRLTPDQNLDALAREHSERMARGEVPFGHDGFQERFNRARVTLSIVRFAENVATNSGYPAATVPEQMVTGWINSPGHRQNLEGNFRISGVGIARSGSGAFFGTQVFAE